MRSRQERIEWIMGIRKDVRAALPPPARDDEQAVALYVQALLQEEAGEEIVKALSSLGDR